ncbi:hypothetical protein [uncultured Tateyamaria sp.]|uniref:hypothetical protein n=1 Tax=uncultured Tateyamaria sp. TaxID=455651 RepID=UPI00261B1A62|nr:hypothetical protein [uncultured Tateyamaria sp.]
MTDLDARLLAAHTEHDHAALVALYNEAAQAAETDDARGFFLTHAYVFALETGDARATALHAELVAMGRDSAV